MNLNENIAGRKQHNITQSHNIISYHLAKSNVLTGIHNGRKQQGTEAVRQTGTCVSVAC